MNGVELITQERQRQIDDEGYTLAHDRLHNDDSLARAAATYALPARSRDYKQLLYGGLVPQHWPWGLTAWKPTKRDWPQDHNEGYWDPEGVRCRVRDLSKAGALIAAEIDRLLHIVNPTKGDDPQPPNVDHGPKYEKHADSYDLPGTELL